MFKIETDLRCVRCIEIVAAEIRLHHPFVIAAVDPAVLELGILGRDVLPGRLLRIHRMPRLPVADGTGQPVELGDHQTVGLAAPHHGQAYGSIVIINPQVPDDDGMGPVRRFTPEVGFPESQGGRQVYSTPWPLAENYHLCVYDAAMNGAPLRRPGENYGIYLVDAFGNKELLYRDPDIGCMNPIPLRPQPLAAAPASPLAEVRDGKPVCIGDEGQATMAVINVYDNQKAWPEGTRIKSLRVLQLLPCAVPSGGLRPHETGKRIAEAGDSVVPCRWVLGTVPVEADGSAHFTVPAERPILPPWPGRSSTIDMKLRKNQFHRPKLAMWLARS